MPEKQGRLAKILEEEYKSKGIVSGVASAGSKRLKEIFDIRNVLFSGSGLGSVVGKKIFGKGYTSTPDSTMASKISAPTSNFSSESIDVLVDIKKDTRISAKNSSVLPSMARDMNLIRQNILKLVKLQGGTAATKADMFFRRAGERETAYEAQFAKKVEPIDRIKNEKTTKESNFFSKFISIIGAGFIALKFVLEQILSFISKIFDTALKIAGLLIASRAVSNFLPTKPSISPKTGTTKTLGKIAAATAGVAAGTATAKAATTVAAKSAGRGIKSKPSQKFSNVGSGGLKVVDSKRETLFKKFLDVVSKRMGRTVATRLSALAATLLVPGVGWIIALVSAGFLASEAYELYKIWQEVSGEKDTSPTNMKAEENAMANLIYDRFREAGFSDAQARGAVANAVAESSLDPEAHNENREDSVGLFQINRRGILGKGYSVEELKDPETNIGIAIAAAKKSPMFNKATNIEESTTAFMKQVENPTDQSDFAIKKRTQIALDMKSSNLGSRVNQNSVQLADANREMTGAPIIVNAPTNTNVQNNNNTQGGGSPAETYNAQFNDLLKLAMGTP